MYGDRPSDPAAASARRPVSTVDVTVAVLLGAVATVEAITTDLGSVVPIWAAAAVLALGRRLGLWTPLAVGAIFAVAAPAGYDMDVGGGWIPMLSYACFVAALVARRRWLSLAAVIASLGLLTMGLLAFTTLQADSPFGVVVTVVPWFAGDALRRALAKAARAAAEAEAARLDASLASERATAMARVKIAAELHDALAHALGEMILGAAVAHDLVGSAPSAARHQLETVARAGRAGLVETGRLLRLLRDDQDELGLGAARPTVAAAPAPLAPPPAVNLRRDAALPAVIAAITTAEIVLSGQHPAAMLVLVQLGLALILCVRRRFPLAMPAAVTALILGVDALGPDASEPVGALLAILLASFAAGYRSSAGRWPLALLAVAPAVALHALSPDGETPLDPVFVGSLVLPCVVGLAMQRALANAAASGAAAEQARHQAELEHERAAAAERRRIARELHDVLANSLSVMIVQATVAAEAVDADPSVAGAAIEEVHRSGSAAMAEIGAMLRHADPEHGASPAPPQHSVSDLQGLADEYARTGMAVDLSIDASAPELPMGLGIALYRIVQEGLTNALKHAPGGAVRVQLVEENQRMVVAVRSGCPDGEPIPAPTSGHGLVGLRERAALFGGELRAGPTDDGGFELAAVLPLTQPDGVPA